MHSKSYIHSKAKNDLHFETERALFYLLHKKSHTILASEEKGGEALAHRSLVVAVAAGEHLVAARRHDLAPAPVMLAPAATSKISDVSR